MSALQKIQHAIADRIAEDELLNTTNILAHDESSIHTRFSESSSLYSGLSILVMPPIPYRNGTPLIFEGLCVKVHVLENRYSNTTGLTSLAAAERICEHLHAFKLPGDSFKDTQLTLAENNPWKVIKDTRHTNCNLLEITFNTTDVPY
tara:strand:+ start:5721 stop:6164 length:444 start_codon:yes stop_codon:yes gene_type:complete